MINIVIIGAGQGGTALIELLHDDPNTNILGVADVRKSAPGITLAKRLKIPTTINFNKLTTLPDLNFVIDVTGKKQVRQQLNKLCRPDGVEVISGGTAKFMWQHIEQRVRGKESLEQMLFQYQSIYDLGLKLSTSQNLTRLLFHAVEDATKLTNTPAGSIALFDERRGEMQITAIKGFSDKFSKKTRWKLRKGGLTASILNSKEPLVIHDVAQHPEFDNPLMLKEGIKSLMAVPLTPEGKITGILYVNDFIIREFTPREASIFSLVGSIAAATIDKARTLETAMLTAITDDLTGLYNHRYFVQRLNTELTRAARYNLQFTLVILDIDNFKQYNDTHGHLKGNTLLQQLSVIMQDNFREVDVIARYGGEEFAVIMPETSPKKSLATIERLRANVAEYPFEGRDKIPGKKVTISVGVASYPLNSQNAHTLIERADAAMYEAKRLGKNRVVFSQSHETPTADAFKKSKQSSKRGAKMTV